MRIGGAVGGEGLRPYCVRRFAVLARGHPTICKCVEFRRVGE